ncbi:MULTISPECIES: SMI1/KNR4 family protein [Streptomyces]|uniref:SMI1/KNR4 family protein n=1 Tax=Streptomyces tsukubensis (strain DSM 42081 / NBRC 108919 / NRRL 18488 / 9993) TaxID=1114943 RepID=I2MVG7_STRT9|nr:MULTISPECIES: SMI1/KNR4 family protein [Streptomyces]AZK93237.1 SMI1/KNR4 family protein [Streptomyces tsukubensis]EIF88764.1 hypothetical protein [Streptomyces tsukubensis NRRL18488]MYS67696.1 SMI1/KNR4 family protein [Streptomyces sp. SID5473]QKM70604.1 SMI1/KNR4 family protein [Streptomyces tsukubensis NRRL18488]TAI41302.1 SMI1/KNR4 family protein [Streptomyces tsukubensis]
MTDNIPSSAPVFAFTTWEPVLRLLRAGRAARSGGPPVRVVGRIGRGSWSLDLVRPGPGPGGAARVEGVQDEMDAVDRVRGALEAVGAEEVSFCAEIAADGRTALQLIGPSSAVESAAGGTGPGVLLLVEGAVPAPRRRLPASAPGAVAAPSADPGLLERTLRERLPDAVGATEAELAAAEERLGIALPAELKALYRATRARRADRPASKIFRAVGCELLEPDRVHIADPSSRPWSWASAALDASGARPGDAVQGLVGSPGWIVFGDTGGGDRLAIDLTPGAGGHIGQIIVISHEENIGAGLVADSLTDLVLGRHSAGGAVREPGPEPVAWVNERSVRSVEAAAHPGLEVLSLGVWEGEPFSLAPVVGLPGLRTLSAHPGTLADPREIAGLTGLEFLELGPADWRVLLDAGAVPRSLLAAGIEDYGRDPLPNVDLANELLALWGRPPIIRRAVKGDLGPPG